MLKQKDLIKALQRAMNGAGANLTIDGEPGPKTIAALENYEITIQLNYPNWTVTAKKELPQEQPVITLPPVDHIHPDLSYFGAPWIGANIDLLGLHESDKRLVERYEPEWKREGLAGYKGLAGRSRAWCSVRENADKRKVGVKGTDSAAASSWSRYGKKCPFWFGASLDIKHPSGGRHVCDFLYWIDEKKKIAATYDGNRDNRLCVAMTDLSGKGDTLVSGPRWPLDYPDGQIVSKEDVLKKYPFLKVGGSIGSGTT